MIAMLRPLLILLSTLCFAGTLLAPNISHAQGDAEAGEKIYLKCRSCHVLDQPTHKMGPHLLNLLGRKAGTVAGFQYSKAMKQAGEDGLIWDENTLKKFLTSPKSMIPDTSMRFWGLWEYQIDDLISYMKQQSPDQK